jgi:hypothetical protein
MGAAQAVVPFLTDTFGRTTEGWRNRCFETRVDRSSDWIVLIISNNILFTPVKGIRVQLSGASPNLLAETKYC